VSVPSVEADVLAVLVRSHTSLTGATIDRLSGRSHAQVHAVLGRLRRSGLVLGTRTGMAIGYELNRDHVLAPAIEVAIGANVAVEKRLRDWLEDCRPIPASVTVFGSFARRTGDSESDIDIAIVRPNDVNEDNDQWATLRYELAERVERWSGNHCQIVELSVSELKAAADQNEPLVASIRAEGRTIIGLEIDELVGARQRRQERST
jgi:predicted nucleotidyltransferase